MSEADSLLSIFLSTVNGQFLFPEDNNEYMGKEIYMQN
ncbi:hypothetical protein M2372_000705 [Chryseobacterium sp. BIGb0232]|nr:hypothetical protein [Chryseobacterium sp. BIGb0232]ROS19866.1 hypothetical protein EDF65_0564 [Chryseobacterium nakagawai]